MRYIIKSIAVGIQVPILEPESINLSSLASGVVSSYPSWFDALKHDIELLEDQSGSTIILYNCVMRVDLDSISSKIVDDEINSIRSEFIRIFTDYLDSQSIEYLVMD